MANASPVQSDDPTVQHLYEAAQDVEMQDAYPVRDKAFLYIVLDTNVLIDHCGIIQQFCEDVERLGYPIMIIIPGAVISELDGQKNNPELQWFSRQATTWILKKVREHTTVKLQASSETLKPGVPVETDKRRRNDLAIRDCCLWFSDKRRGYGALMVSMDNNHCLECMRDGIPTCTPPQRGWSSRQLAQQLPVGGVDLAGFRDRETFPRYRPSRAARPKRLAQTEGPTSTPLTIADDDMMDIDQEDHGAREEYFPLHARDSLHQQMGEHFTQVLRDLASDVHKKYGDSLAISDSAHAPAFRRLELQKWTAGHCLSYLDTKQRFKREVWMPSFFAKRGEDGWRRGQDWPPVMWSKALDMLQDVGERFDDRALLSSISAVRPHVTEVWEAKLRPN